MEYLLSLLALGLGGMLVLHFKSGQNKANTGNLQTLLDNEKLEGDKSVNDVLLQAEEELRNKKLEKKDATPEENADFFNNLKP